MRAQSWIIGAWAMLATVAASSAVPPPRAANAVVPAASAPRLHLAGVRSLQQRLSGSTAKLDSALADLSGHLSQVRSDHALEDLYALNPAARFMQRSAAEGPLVLVDAVTTGDPQKLKSALVSLGMQHAAVYSNDVGGFLPLAQLANAAARAEVHFMRASMPRTRIGAVTSQGDFAQHSDVLRSTYSALNGTGVTVGVMSDSYDCYDVYAEAGSKVPVSGPTGYAPNGFTASATTDISTGDLPSSVALVATSNAGEFPCLSYGAPTLPPFSDEGRAMLQIVHDVAPGASLAFHTAEWSEADFASGVTALAAAGAKVIADDVGYFDEPFYQDGIIAQAIDTVEGKGVAYFSAAGNSADHAWESTNPTFVALPSPPVPGELLVNFDTTGATKKTTLSVDIPGLQQGELLAVVVEWDQPYVTGAPHSGGATSHIDLCISGAGANTIINTSGVAEGCTGANATGSDPVQVLIVDNPANAPAVTAATTLNITVGLLDGTAPPGRIRVAVDDGGAGATIDPTVATHSSTMQGHPNAAGAAAIGAAAFFSTPACGTSPAVLEKYSALGSVQLPILFDSAGTRLATPVLRQKPDFVGPDGGDNTFLGFTLAKAGADFQDHSTIAQCLDNTSYPNFFGTSAATPHAAAIAALMLQANPALTPTQIYTALRTSALPMSGTTPDPSSGSGFIQADAALKLLPPGPPALSLSASSVMTGGTTTLSWSSINTSSCTASGSWSGAQKTSGSATITAPSTAGDAAYTLTCTNSEGSANATVHLTVMAASSHGGGGGAVDELSLLVLAALGCLRLLRPGRDSIVSPRRHRGP